jgi:hypothetical protein
MYLFERKQVTDLLLPPQNKCPQLGIQRSGAKSSVGIYLTFMSLHCLGVTIAGLIEESEGDPDVYLLWTPDPAEQWAAPLCRDNPRMSVSRAEDVRANRYEEYCRGCGVAPINWENARRRLRDHRRPSDKQVRGLGRKSYLSV